MENSSIQKLTFGHHCETQSSLQMRDQELRAITLSTLTQTHRVLGAQGALWSTPRKTVFSMCDLLPIHGEPHCVRRHQILEGTFLRKSLVMFTDSICVCGQFCDQHQSDNI